MITEQTVVQAAIQMSWDDRTTLSAGSVVYFIGCAENGTVKIGVSVAPSMRLDQLRTGCPYPLEILATVPGDRRTESALHRRFTQLGIGGEWFKNEGELQELIAKIVAGERVELEPAGTLPLPGFEPETLAGASQLTALQREVLIWLTERISGQGYAPTAREVERQFGTAARDHVDSLVRKECIEVSAGRSRTIVITPRGIAETKHDKGVTGWIEFPDDRCPDCQREFFGEAMDGHECMVADLVQAEPEPLLRRSHS